MDIKQQTYQLIDDLKSVCHNYGMGNDGNEYKVITQIFLYKFPGFFHVTGIPVDISCHLRLLP